MKVKNLIFYITIFIGLTSCEKDFIDQDLGHARDHQKWKQ